LHTTDTDPHGLQPANGSARTIGNWLEPDPICLKFGELNLATAKHRAPTGARWAERFLAIDLWPTVPSEVREMWEAAQQETRP
jgi:hypothetical protein